MNRNVKFWAPKEINIFNSSYVDKVLTVKGIITTERPWLENSLSKINTNNKINNRIVLCSWIFAKAKPEFSSYEKHLMKVKNIYGLTRYPRLFIIH